MPDAARISDSHVCPKVEPGPVPHVGGPIFSGSADVIVGFLPAARKDDSVVCFPVGPSDRIQQGSATVLINHRQAARRTDPAVHIGGDRIVDGCPTVVIGDSTQSFVFREAAKLGTPFCEECERKRREYDSRDDSATPDAPDPETVTLDDEAPVGARSGRDAFADLDFTKHELAGMLDSDDGLSEARMQARYAVAYQFYAAHTPDTVKPSEILSHIKGIDLEQPVIVRSFAGKTMHQRSIPGAGVGQYFTLDPSITPEQVGVSPMSYGYVDGKPGPPPLLREPREVAFDEPALGLQSTAAPIVDDWSLKDARAGTLVAVYCPGGATQVMIPRKFHPSAEG
ncbi:PAAR domain-containing protein [Nannocystis bainbridge]|uniref:PAAR domain-containing protein n=1 Tax=Nannocystis bainbridge TaxID=2995303 RepID=A0ABT5DS23_9BACT|nr:PAAR domain-containing protein [Nannocystis bainbridge]MDC0716452.1 PAAR domain-containing protein [Nannocystis bainbridge]